MANYNVNTLPQVSLDAAKNANDGPPAPSGGGGGAAPPTTGQLWPRRA